MNIESLPHYPDAELAAYCERELLDVLSRDEDRVPRNVIDECARRVSGPILPIVRDTPKIGRNEPCPCGSGKKYKKCCLGSEAQ